MVSAALLVAPADIEQPDSNPDLRNFAPIPLAPLPFPSLVVASDNDPYCEVARAREFARSWGSEFVNIGHAGHINTDAGFGEWPEGESLLRRLAGASLPV